MRDDAKNVETTEGNQIGIEESTDAGDHPRPLRDRRPGSRRTTPGSSSPGGMSMKADLDGVTGTPTLSALQRLFANGRAPLIWGVLWGVIQAAAPLGLWWLDAATVYGMSIALIATVYIGFAVADGRPAVIAVETTVAGAFVVLAAAGTGSAWLIVLGFVGHGLKDLWQHRSHFVANTRWWPPFCMTIDFVAAAIIAVAIVKGVTFDQ
jgi:hypothetical protein